MEAGGGLHPGRICATRAGEPLPGSPAVPEGLQRAPSPHLQEHSVGLGGLALPDDLGVSQKLRTNTCPQQVSLVCVPQHVSFVSRHLSPAGVSGL